MFANCGTKGHFVGECHKKRQDWKNTFKGLSQITTTNKIQLLVIAKLSIFAICKDSCFVGSRVSQHLTFQRKVFSTFEEFTLSHEIYLGDNNMLDVFGKNTIVFNLPNRISKCIGDLLYVPKLAKNLLLIS
jgi:hypothetical protein